MTSTKFKARDGAMLAVHVAGPEDGRPLILVHGLFSNAQTNWIKYGHAELLGDAGHRVIMPDLRAHGVSAAPQEAEYYPDGVLARDLHDLVAYLGLEDYDLGGFSLGARTTVQAVGEGLTPRRALLMGMGLEGLTGWAGRQAFFQDVIARHDTVQRGDPAYFAAAFMKSMKIDPVAAALLLPSFEDAQPGWLDAFTMPTAVICGAEDRDNGSPQALVDALPDARLETIPGTHMSSVTHKALGRAIAAFLAS